MYAQHVYNYHKFGSIPINDELNKKIYDEVLEKRDGEAAVYISYNLKSVPEELEEVILDKNSFNYKPIPDILTVKKITIANANDIRIANIHATDLYYSNIYYYFTRSKCYNKDKVAAIWISKDNPRHLEHIKSCINYNLKKTDSKYIDKMLPYLKDINRPKEQWLLLKALKEKYSKECSDILFNSKKPFYIYYLALYSNDNHIFKKCIDFLFEKESYHFLRLLVKAGKYKNVDRIEEAILNSKDIHNMKKMAKTMDDKKIDNNLSNYVVLL